jgi:VWFA-related protein
VVADTSAGRASSLRRQEPTMRTVLGVALAWIAAASAVPAGQLEVAQPPAFRSGVDVTAIDVSVLDKDRHPITGLTAADFTVVVDGKPRPVVSFKAVELAPSLPMPAAAWMRDVAPDVVTNVHPSGRLIAIMLDDASLIEAGDGRALQKTREVAKAAIAALGPDDLAAVLSTSNAHSSQDFTSDRQRLVAAVDDAALIPEIAEPPNPGSFIPLQDVGDCYCRLCAVEALGSLAEALRSVPGERKVVLYISIGPVVTSPAFFINPDYRVEDRVTRDCMEKKQEAMQNAFNKAALANVTIEAVDPKGLTLGDQPKGPRDATAMLLDFDKIRIESLRAIAESTGGRAVVNNNDMEKEVPALLEESSSYYLLGVDAGTPRDDGHYHPIRVSVNRPGVEVRARNGFYAPTAKERTARIAKAALNGDPASMDAAIDGVVPRADVALAASLAPFLGTDGTPVLAMVFRIAEPGPTRGAMSASRHESVLLTARAIGPEDGKEKGSAAGSLDLTISTRLGQPVRYEGLMKMALAPGRYSLRAAARTGDGAIGSVYANVDVPDFAKALLSLSGVVVAVSPPATAAPVDAFQEVLDVVPTAGRVFSPFDDVSTLVRVYQGGTMPVVPITMSARLIDSQNAEVRTVTTPLDASTFGSSRSADYHFEVPVDQLPPGEYLLQIDAVAGVIKRERTVRFTIVN